MAAGEVSVDILDHGRIVSEPNCRRRRVECKYCDKSMRGYLLKYHLGRIPGRHVTTCPNVPQSVEESFRRSIEEAESAISSEDWLEELTGEVSVDIRDHHRTVSEPNCRRKGRVECKYCDKSMYGYRLKYHLGGIPGRHVTTCPNVPQNVKDSFRSIIETKRATCAKELAVEDSVDIHDHGVTLVGPKHRVQCKYCGKVMSRLYRLKNHLGGIPGGGVTFCPKVPRSVKKSVRSILETEKATHPQKRRCLNVISQTSDTESGNSIDTDSDLEDWLMEPVEVPSKRVVSQIALNADQNKDSTSRSIIETEKATHPQKRRRCLNGSGFNKSKSVISQASDPESGNSTDSDSESEDWLMEPAEVPKKRVVPQIAVNADQDKDSTSRFFYETGIDYTEVKEMQEYVKIIRQSWKRTGCGILLDGWIDEKGRNLVSFIVDCPQGPVYLHSSDVSTISDNVDALQLLLDGVIKDVGVQNVVQVVAFSSSGWVGALGKQFVDRYKSIFWTVDASHCLELILDKIAAMDDIKATLDKGKVISEFLHSHPTLSKLLSDYTDSHYLIKPSRSNSATPFLILDSLVSKKQSLSAVCASSKWKTSTLASGMEGKRVANLVADVSFWKGAEMVINLTFPLVKVLNLINTDDKQQMGHFYEAMDQAKQTFKEEFSGKESRAISEIWDGHLRSPLHAAGYYLNPSLFYSDDFHINPEVFLGLLCCIVRLAPDTRIQDLISKQLVAYKHSKGAFSLGSSVEQRNKLSPASWWLVYGEEYPELQHFATRILSQTCVGASKYTLKRSLAEMVISNVSDRSRNAVEHQSLSDQAFVHYNLQLQQQHSNQSSSSLGDEGMADHSQPTCSSSSSFKQKNAEIQSNSNGTGSIIIVKATYKEDTVRFKFDPSAGCYQLHEEVAKRFKLQNGTFKIKYLDDEEEWVMLTTDSDLQECLEIVDSTGKRIVKFLVCDNMGSSGSSKLQLLAAALLMRPPYTL